MNRFLIVAVAFATMGAGCLAKPVLDMSPPAEEPSEAVEQATTPTDVGAMPTEPATTTPTVVGAEPPTEAAVPTPTTQAPTPKPAPKPVVKPPAQIVGKVYVSITDTGFSPKVIAVSKGDTVVWTNKGTSNHTVESTGSNIYHSGNIPPGTSYSRVFSAPGSYNYHDGVHPSLTGTVSVR